MRDVRIRMAGPVVGVSAALLLTGCVPQPSLHEEAACAAKGGEVMASANSSTPHCVLPNAQSK